MACHALVGVETMIVMAVVFSMDRRGKGTHETKFVKDLLKDRAAELKFYASRGA
jgi:hypothetical protein